MVWGLSESLRAPPLPPSGPTLQFWGCFWEALGQSWTWFGLGLMLIWCWSGGCTWRWSGASIPPIFLFFDFEPFFESKRGPQIAPRRIKIRSRGLQRPSGPLRGRPEVVSEVWGIFLIDFGLFWGRLLTVLGSICLMLGRFGTDLRTFWVHVA